MVDAVFPREELERRDNDPEIQEEIARDQRDRREAGRRLRELEEAERQAMADRPQEYARRELARRQLCTEHFLPFVMRFNPDYHAGWVHKDMCQRLERFSEQVANRESPRLMITVPPRHGKSELTSKKFPPWHLGKYPNHEIMACSYSGALSISFSRLNREIIRDPAYQVMFDTRLHPDSQGAEAWMTTEGGGYVAAGVGGAITGKGAHCFPAGTPVATSDGELPIEQVKPGMCVLTCDPRDGTIGTAYVEAGLERDASDLIELGTATGKRVRVTGNHSFFVPAVGWIEARHLEAGDPVILHTGTGSVHELPDLSGTVFGGHPEGYPQPTLDSGLLAQLPGAVAKEAVPDLQPAVPPRPVTQREVLLESLSPGPDTVDQKDVSMVRDGVSAEITPDAVLFTELCQPGARATDDWSRQLALHRWHELRALVSGDTAADLGAGQWLRDLRHAVGFDHTSHQRAAGGQPARKSCGDVSPASCDTPQIALDTISLVKPLRGESHRVYDIQVAGTHCFFAGSVLVHNCLIIDDPVKNREDAESEATRQTTWDWYTSTAYTRLAPGGGVIVILTRWHDDDLAGRLVGAMKEGADQWEIVNYPAVATQDERYRKAGEALHPERYDIDALLRIQKAIGPRDWAALYQQNPVPDEGAFFSRDDILWYDYNDPGALPPAKQLVDYSAWDLAISQSQDSDFSVGGVVSIDMENELWVRHVRRGKWGALDLCRQILGLHRQWRPDRTGIEKGMIEMSIGPFLEEMKAQERLWDFHYTELKPGRQDKVARARAIQGMFQAKKVHVPFNAPWTEVFVNELLRFPTGVNDDQVDFISWIGQMLMIMSPATIRMEKKPSWRDKLHRFTTGGSTNVKSAMSA